MLDPLLYGVAVLVGPALVVAARPGVSPSRRLLAAALAALVPGAGLLLALMVRRVRGGAVAPEPAEETPPPRLSIADVHRLAESPPVLDRLLTSDPAERLEALVALSSAADAATVATLRWAIEHGPPDVVLEAALTLEEIELRGEARMAATREMLGDGEPDLALAAADASAALLTTRLADPAVAATFAEQARTCYRMARAWAPARADEIDERLARLELAAGEPRTALAIVAELLDRGGDRERLAALRDDAAFAARRFDEVGFAPCAIEAPARPAARMLQTALS